MSEWNEVPLTYIEESDVQVGLRNDEKNLYVLFCFYDAKWARAIRMDGITMWLDGSGKRKKHLGLCYTGGPPEKLTAVTKEKQWTIASATDGSGDPIVRSGSVRGLYVYEFSVPLGGEDARDFALAAQPGQAISLGLKWGGMNDDDRKRMTEQMSGRGGMGPGGGRGGGVGRGGRGGGKGPGGRRGGPGGMERPESSEEQEVWLRTTLALPSEQ
jgi:hypothetical protein